MTDYVAEAVAGLSSTDLYIDSGASLSNASTVASAYDSDQIGIAVLPELASQTFSANTLAAQILQKTGEQYQTIVVVIDDARDHFGVASKIDAAQIAQQLNSGHNGDAGTSLIRVAQTLQNGSPSNSSGESADLLPGIVGGLVGVTILAAAVMFYLKRLKNRENKTSLAYIPAELTSAVTELNRVQQIHHNLGTLGLGPQLKTIVDNTQQLFKRIEKTGGEQQTRIASVEYADIFSKLNKALGEDYFIDIQQHPELWDNPQQRLTEVATAVKATENQLIENIQQVNASRDLEFQVALESLTKAMQRTKVEDMLKTQEGEQK